MDPPSERSAAAPSSLFDSRYELCALLGSGATARVYRARDHNLNGAPVALKIFHGAAAAEGERLVREARLLYSISHPHIVRALGFGRAELGADEPPLPYLVLELLEGRTLDTVIADAPVTEPQAVRYLSELASALAELHGHQIVHRDIKPSNILITADDHLKMLDFGIARSLNAQSCGSSMPHAAGTVAYLAPELLHGGEPSKAADVYGWGLIALELFRGREAEQRASSLLPAPERRRIRHALNRIPGALYPIVSVALSHKPLLRYEDGQALVEALRHATVSAPARRAVQRVTGAVERHWPRLVGVSVAAALLFRLLLWNSPMGWVVRDFAGLHGAFHLGRMLGTEISIDQIKARAGLTSSCDLMQLLASENDPVLLDQLIRIDSPQCEAGKLQSMLQHAAAHGMPQVVALLLDNGAQPSSTEPALGFALQNRDLVTAQEFWKRGHTRYCAAQFPGGRLGCDPAFIKEMFRRGASPLDPVYCGTEQKPSFHTLLDAMLLRGCNENIEVILQHPLVRSDYVLATSGLGAVSFAIYQDRPEVVRLLLEGKMDPLLTGGEGGIAPLNAVLHSRFGTPSLLSLLLEAEGILNTPQWRGVGVLHRAVHMNWLDGVALLATRRGLREERDYRGFTPLHYAVRRSLRLSLADSFHEHERPLADEDLVSAELVVLLLAAGVSPTEGRDALAAARAEPCPFCVELIEAELAREQQAEAPLPAGSR